MVIDLNLTRSVCVLTGVAGSVATVLHDAVMNPAEGKKKVLRRFVPFYNFLFVNKPP